MSTLVVPQNLTSPRDDAVHLYKAFKGSGCDTKTVINILAHRDSTQRALIAQEYEATYSETLEKRLTSELNGDLKKAVLLWMPDPVARDALIVKEELSSILPNFEVVTGIICARTPSQLQQIKDAYFSKFGAKIELDIEKFIQNNHLKLLLAYLRAQRSEGLEVDREMALEDIKALYMAGEKKLRTDEKVFIPIFSERSRAHMVFLATTYSKFYGNSLTKAIKKTTSGDFQRGLLTILRCAQNPTKYFAKVLYKSMKGLGTNDSTLISVIVTRTEIDMQFIKDEYKKKYKKSLTVTVSSDTSGAYRTFLLDLLGPPTLAEEHGTTTRLNK